MRDFALVPFAGEFTLVISGSYSEDVAPELASVMVAISASGAFRCR